MKFKITFLLAENIKNPIVFQRVTRIQCYGLIGSTGEIDIETNAIQTHEYSTSCAYRLYADDKLLGIVDGWATKIAAILVEEYNPKI